MSIYLYIFILGGIGAILRFLLVSYASPQIAYWSTFVVNILGCFLVGVILAIQIKLPDQVKLALIVGLLGALTTFSSFSVDVLRLFQQGSYAKAFLYVAATNVACIVLCFSGFELTKWLKI